MVDFFVAAVAVALAVGVASVCLALWFVRRESRELERKLAERDDALRRMVEERVKEAFDQRRRAEDPR
jgi:amino acid transporter